MSLLLLFPVLELWFLNDHSSRPDRFLPAVGSTVDTYNPWTLLEKLGNPIGMFTYESRLVENTVFDWNYPGLTYLNDAISSLRKSGKPVYHSVKKNILHMLNFSLFEFLFESRKDRSFYPNSHSPAFLFLLCPSLRHTGVEGGSRR